MVRFLHRCLVLLGRNHQIKNSVVHTAQPQRSILRELPFLPLLNKSTIIHQWQSQVRRTIPSLCSSMVGLSFRSVSPLRSPIRFSSVRSASTLTVDLQDSLLASSDGRMGKKSPSSSSSLRGSLSGISPPSWSSSSSSSHHDYPSSSSKLPSPRVVYVSSGNGGGSSSSSFSKRFIIGFIMIECVIRGCIELYLRVRDKTSVIKLQVCLSGCVVRSLQKDLHEIAQLADTSTNQELNYVLKETILALLRHPECIISAHSYVDVNFGFENGEKRFNQFSIQEREKVDHETHVAFNHDIQYIVVTILVFVSGEQKLDPIIRRTDLKKALRYLGSLSSEEIKAVEVLWTPQQENERISEVTLLLDYPYLKPLHEFKSIGRAMYDYIVEYNHK